MFVEGQLRTSKWQDQQGVERYSTEIQLTPYNGTLTFLDARGNGNGTSRASAPASASDSERPRGSDLDDDIPF